MYTENFLFKTHETYMYSQYNRSMTFLVHITCKEQRNSSSNLGSLNCYVQYKTKTIMCLPTTSFHLTYITVSFTFSLIGIVSIRTYTVARQKPINICVRMLVCCVMILFVICHGLKYDKTNTSYSTRDIITKQQISSHLT